MRAKKEQTKKQKNFSSPYLNARREWNERYGSYISRARNWRNITILVGAIALVSAAANYVQASKEKVAVYYVNTDNGGGVTNIWRADVSTPGPKTEQIKAAIRNWLLGARTVYIDGRATRHVINATYAMTMPNSPAYNMLSDYHKNNNPFERAAEETVEVKMQQPVQLTDNTWQMDWTETTRNIKSPNEKPKVVQYQLTVNAVIATPESEQQLIANPIGLYVKQFSWTEKN